MVYYFHDVIAMTKLEVSFNFSLVKQDHLNDWSL